MYWNVTIAGVPKGTLEININMRCIEIEVFHASYCCNSLININMRCIEIFDYISKTYAHYGLTLTWDVLKWGRLLQWKVFC